MDIEPDILDKHLPVTDAEDFSARQQLKIVASDVRALFDSEISYYKARISYTSKVAKWTGVYLLISACAFFGAVVASILGALLIAASFIGPFWGVICVVTVSLIVSIAFALLARSKSRDFLLPEIDTVKANE